MNNEKTGFRFNSRAGTVILLALVLFASMICMIPFRDSQLVRLENIQVGDQTESFFCARCDFNYRDLHEYARIKKEYAKELENMPDYYALNELRTEEIGKRIEQFYNAAVSRQQGKGTENSDVLNLPPEDVQAISETQKDFLMQDVMRILKQGILPDKIKNGILNNNKKSEWIRIFYPSTNAAFRVSDARSVLCVSEAASEIAKLFINTSAKDETYRLRLEKLISDYIGTSGNLSEDQVRKNLEIELAKKNSDAKLEAIPYDKNCRKGEFILPRGKVITAEDKAMLESYCKALREKEDKSIRTIAKTWLKKFALVCMVLAFTVVYIYHIHPEIRVNNRKVFVLGSIAVFSVILNRVSLSFYDWLCSNTGMPVFLLVLIIPLAVPAALISVIYGLRTAIFVVIYVSSVTAISVNGITQLVSGASGMAMDQSFAVLLSGLFTGAAAGYAVRTSSDYKKFASRIFICTILVMLAIGAAFLLGNVMPITEKEFLKGAGSLILFNGFLTAVSSLLLLMVLETCGVATNIYYYSLSNTNNRLLSQMQESANGTFHHSQNVSRIAGKAARKIKSNVFRVKACAWYHDIGKLKNPAWFAENQTKRTGNPMEGMSPEEAVECLRSHVSYGVELARKNKLPRTIIETILQHHGTDYVSYFYQNLKKKPADDAPYRYPGPVPMDAENVIIMFADTADAINSSCPDITREELREKLEVVLQKKLVNGQLKNAHITMREIYDVLDVLADELAGVKQDGSRGTGSGYEEKKETAKS